MGRSSPPHQQAELLSWYVCKLCTNSMEMSPSEINIFHSIFPPHSILSKSSMFFRSCVSLMVETSSEGHRRDHVTWKLRNYWRTFALEHFLIFEWNSPFSSEDECN